MAIVRAAIERASAGRALRDALADPDLRERLRGPVHAIAAGKAAASMAMVLAGTPGLTLRSLVAIGTHKSVDLASAIEWHEAGHPLPDERSQAAGERALAVAGGVRPGELLLLALSGGASALMALPDAGLTLDDKRHTSGVMLREGADIHALNTVRKHLSAIKGGRLATACGGATLTLAVSDVLDDDVSVIGSGPGVADDSTWADAARAIERFGGAAHPAAVRRRLDEGLAGVAAETPKRGDPRLRQADGRVIASRRDAITGARHAAGRFGYSAVVLPDAVTGEAREAAARWLAIVRLAARGTAGPLCVISAGETTVRVTGTGSGGRNQEFALAIAASGALEPGELVASVGTDGIDGPTDAAGARVDASTLERARTAGLDASTHLERNDAYRFFAPLGDLIRLGRTDTNVGDLQVYLRAGGPSGTPV